MCSPAVAFQSTIHWTQVASLSGLDRVAGIQAPSSTWTSTASTPRSGAHATPATVTWPAGTDAPLRGTSMRDWVRIGPVLDQPSGTQ